MNQAVQLMARGLQDTWLSGNPQVSFYRSMYKRYVQFGSSIEQFVVPDNGKIVINAKSDLLGYTYLTAHDTATGTLVPDVNWSNIISTVDLNIGNQIIATHDIVYINTIQKALEADTYSSRSQTNTFQPLGFFFDKQALPIVALRYTDVKINITWVSDAVSKQYVYKCWAHCIRLADEERQFFSTATHRLLIPQMQRVRVTQEPNFHGPLKYIAAPCINYANVYFSSAIPPPAITNLTVSGARENTVDLAWTAAPGATSYSITSSPATTTQTTSNPSSYTFTGLSPATAYTFTVTSVNMFTPGGSATSSSITTTPAAVTNLTVSGATPNTVNLAWTAASGATSYSIVSSPATTTQTTSNPSSYTFTGLSPSTAYTFTVTSVNAGGSGDSATSASITTALGPVTNLEAVSKTATTADLTWTATTGATSYSMVTSPETTTQTTSGTSYTFTGLTDATNYTVTVTSIDASGAGGSATATVFKNKLFGSAAIVNNAPGTNTALSLPGTVGNYAQINTLQASPIGNNLFIEAWVYFNSIGSTAQTIFSMGSASTEYMSIKVADAGEPEIAGPFTCSLTNGDGTVTTSSAINRSFLNNSLYYSPGDEWLRFYLPQPAQYWSSFQLQIYITKKDGTPVMSKPDFFVQAEFQRDDGNENWFNLGFVDLLPFGTTWPAGSYNTTYNWAFPLGIPAVKDRYNSTLQPSYRFRVLGGGFEGETFYDIFDLIDPNQVVLSGFYNDFRAQANQWNHIAFTWSNDSKTLSSFCNGMWVKTETQTAAAPLFSSRSGVGASFAGTATPFNGYIRNLRIVQGGYPQEGNQYNLETNPNFIPEQTFDAGNVPSYTNGGTNVYTLIPFPTP